MHLLIRHRPVGPALLVLDVPVKRGDRRIDQLGHLTPIGRYGAATTAADGETAIRSQNHRSRHRRSPSGGRRAPWTRGGTGMSGRSGSRLSIAIVRGRRIASVVVIAVAAAVAALAAGTPAEATTAGQGKATPVRGNFAGRIAIGNGRKLYLRCKGSGRPVVILESGIHDSSDPWALTQSKPPV